ncbi:hypothetical protein [Psychrobacter sp. BI730]|uniref:hypothetical protein n=1 Tax=Psychrobacter sp. BI730 TaxID=2705463 RepID=UPI0015CBF5AC|nr:hypothetical protein [Psychrobacter sp. BI730]NYR09577.1 hypothetical protein [Psychrobacter sp. BI730]
MTDEYTLQSDDEQFEHAISHAQMMWRLAYKHECERRHAKMKFNEAMAREALEAQAEQDRLDARQLAAREANEAQRELKRDLNRIFWHRVMKFITAVTVLAVAYRLIIMFWS